MPQQLTDASRCLAARQSLNDGDEIAPYQSDDRHPSHRARNTDIPSEACRSDSAYLKCSHRSLDSFANDKPWRMYASAIFQTLSPYRSRWLPLIGHRHNAQPAALRAAHACMVHLPTLPPTWQTHTRCPAIAPVSLVMLRDFATCRYRAIRHSKIQRHEPMRTFLRTSRRAIGCEHWPLIRRLSLSQHVAIDLGAV